MAIYSWGYAGFSLPFYLPGFHFGPLFWVIPMYKRGAILRAESPARDPSTRRRGGHPAAAGGRGGGGRLPRLDGALRDVGAPRLILSFHWLKHFLPLGWF